MFVAADFNMFYNWPEFLFNILLILVNDNQLSEDGHQALLDGGNDEAT